MDFDQRRDAGRAASQAGEDGSSARVEHAAHAAGAAGSDDGWQPVRQQAEPRRPVDSFARNAPRPAPSATVRMARHAGNAAREATSAEAVRATARFEEPVQQPAPSRQGVPGVASSYRTPAPGQTFEPVREGRVAPAAQSGEAAKGVFGDLSMAQVIAGALAAVTSLLLSSVIGLAGSVIGVAVASVVSTVSSQVYKHMLARSAENIKSHVNGDADDSDKEWERNIENGTAARPIPAAAASQDAQATTASGVGASRKTATPHLGDKGAMTHAGMHKRAAKAKRTKVQRGVIIVSIASALVAVIVYAVFINVATQGQGVGTKTASIVSTQTAADTSSQSTSGQSGNSTDHYDDAQAPGPHDEGTTPGADQQQNVQNNDAATTNSTQSTGSSGQSTGSGTSSSTTDGTTSSDQSSTGSSGTSGSGTSSTGQSGASSSTNGSTSTGGSSTSGSGSTSGSASAQSGDSSSSTTSQSVS